MLKVIGLVKKVMVVLLVGAISAGTAIGVWGSEYNYGESRDWSFLIVDGKVDSSLVRETKEELSKLPEVLTDRFSSDGWQILVTDKNIDSYFLNGRFGSVMGWVSLDTNQIYIEAREKAIREATIHEFGHYFDRVLGSRLSETSEFWSIYNSESQAERDSFGATCYWNNCEFFAESFWYYWVQADELYNNCPLVYSYIDMNIKDFK